MGEVLKLKIIVPLSSLKANESASVPFTVRSVASTVEGIHRVGEVDDEIHRLRVDEAVAGRMVRPLTKPTSSASVTASC